MSFRFDRGQSNRSYRRSTFEHLEARELLDGSGIVDRARAEWTDFNIANNVNVYEIAATELSVEKLKHGIAQAKLTPGDDLIVLHTTESLNRIEFNTPNDEFVIDMSSRGTLTIVAMGNAPLTIDAAMQSRIFNLVGGQYQIGGLTLLAGYTQTNLLGEQSLYGLGGGMANAGTVKLSRMTIEGCAAGSGLFDPTSEYSSYFSKGGGIYNSGTMTVIDSLFVDNRALSSVCNKINTTAYGAGGAIYNDDNGVLRLDNTTFTANKAEAELIPYVTKEGEQSVTRYERQQGSGGAIYSNKGSVTIVGGMFSGNSAYNGGGLYSLGSTVECASQVLFEYNSAVSDGGGVSAWGSAGNMKIDRCEFFGNSTKGSGGAIASRHSLTIVNSVLSGNDAGANGGGFFLAGTSTSSLSEMEIVNCTVTGNRAGTVSQAKGAGIYFSGMNQNNECAKLYIYNTIAIDNKVLLSSDPDQTDIAVQNGSSEYCFGYYTLTSFTDWKRSIDNPPYNPDVSPFKRDYNFETQIRGDYRLNSRIDPAIAIDLGYNKVTSDYDFAGNDRIYNGTVDLGAYEFYPTIFDSAFPTGLSVQKGCDFNLRCSGTDANGIPITKYLIDLNDDGEFDVVGSDLWVFWGDLMYRTDEKAYLCMALENELGERSQTEPVEVALAWTAPSIMTRKSSLSKAQLLILSIDVEYYGRIVRRWTVKWGDTTETEYNYRSNSLTVAHYYQLPSATAAYNVTLILDSGGEGDQIEYYIANHPIAVSPGGSPVLEGSAVDSVLTSLPDDPSDSTGSEVLMQWILVDSVELDVVAIPLTPRMQSCSSSNEPDRSSTTVVPLEKDPSEQRDTKIRHNRNIPAEERMKNRLEIELIRFQSDFLAIPNL